MEEIVIGFISDTHLRDDILLLDGVDLWIHCGDMLEKGSMSELKKAAAFFKSELRGREMLFTPGNHDNVFETSREKEAIAILRDAGIKTYIDAGEILRVKEHEISIYFMPWVPETSSLHGFNLEDEERRKYIERIPHDIDILISHGPPDYILDSGPPDNYHYGCELLLEKISVLKSSLRIHAFGHVHQGRGHLKADSHSPLFINAAFGSGIATKPILVKYPSCNVITY